MGSVDISRSPTMRGRAPRSARPVSPPAGFSGGHSRLRWPSILIVSVDAVLLMVPVLADPHQIAATTAVAALWLLMGGRRYRPPLHLSVLDELPALAGRLLAAAMAVAIVLALSQERAAVTALLRNTAMVFVLVVMGRVLTTRLIGWSRTRGSAVQRTILIGGGPLGADLVDLLDGNPEYGLAVVGFLDDVPDRSAAERVPWLGRVTDLADVVAATGASAVLISDDDGRDCELVRALRPPARLRCDIFAVPRCYHLHLRPGVADRIGPIPVVRILPANLAGSARVIRRVLDLAVALLGLMLCGLILAVASPVTGFRVLIGGRAAPLAWRRSFAAARRLCGVLCGDLALVGPRRDDPAFAPLLSQAHACYASRERARAGLISLARVNGVRGETSVHDRARYDNYYIEHWTFWLDVKICLRGLAQLVLAYES